MACFVFGAFTLFSHRHLVTRLCGVVPPPPLPPSFFHLPLFSFLTRWLQLWDTAGQERFRNIAVAYFRGAQGIMLVFDLTKRATFTAVEGWVKDVEKNTDKKVAKILVGNKVDIASDGGKRAVAQAEAQKLADSYGMPYVETSAKSGLNVEDAFEQLAKLSLDNVKKEKELKGGQGGFSPQGVSSKVNLKAKKETVEEEKKKSWC